MIAALAPGESVIEGLPDARDVRSTAVALGDLGVGIEWPEGASTARVTPPAAWNRGTSLDCGNSGTTARLLSGVLTGLGLAARIDGDDSLRSRPMDRVVYPLQAMGARIHYLDAVDRLPVQLEERASGGLRVLRYRSRITSAQVKSSLVLAALGAGVEFEMWEPGRSRDHTERMLSSLGLPLTFGEENGGSHLLLQAGAIKALEPLDVRIPGDPSSAAFLLGGAVLAGRPLRVTDLCLNPIRTAFLEVLEEMGVEVEIEVTDEWCGEPVGTVSVSPAPLHGIRIEAGRIPGLLDELPLIAALGARASGTTEISGAGELRVKESDRLSATVESLVAVGARAEERPDGMIISGDPLLVPRGRVLTRGDHRMAMAFGTLSLVPGAEVDTDDPGCVRVSYPNFWEDSAMAGGLG
jgi:3-phosphoshikimate 1-carboxyvinyltransferase